MRPEPGIRTEDLGDLINVALEEPVRQGFELPGFTTSQEAAQRGRAKVNRGFYTQVYDALGAEGHQPKGSSSSIPL
jgi:hypothetical protein